MNGTEVRARVARLRSDWENAKRDHTQANASQAGVELLVGFFEDITKEEDETQKEQLPQEGSGGAPPGGASGDPVETDKQAPAGTQPQTQPDATGIPGEQKPAEGTTDTAKAAS